METLTRIVKKKDFGKYDIPTDFGDEAEITIRSVNKNKKKESIEGYQMAKLQENSGMVEMLNEPEEDIWNAL